MHVAIDHVADPDRCGRSGIGGGGARDREHENGENGEKALFADLLYILRASLFPYDEEAKTLAQCISLCAEAILHPNDPDSALPFAWEQIAWDRVTEILFDTIEAALPPEAAP